MRAEEAQARENVAHAAQGGRNLPEAVMGAEAGTAAVGQTKSEASRLMEAVTDSANMRLAYQRVVENKGAPGMD